MHDPWFVIICWLFLRNSKTPKLIGQEMTKKIWTQNFIPHKVYATGNIDLPCIDKQGKIYQLEILIRNYNHFPLMTTFFIVLFSLKLLADTKKLQKSL